MVVYKGIIANEDTGLPLVTEKEAQAIAAFVAYSVLYKDAIRTRDSGMLQIAQDIYNK